MNSLVLYHPEAESVRPDFTIPFDMYRPGQIQDRELDLWFDREGSVAILQLEILARDADGLKVNPSPDSESDWTFFDAKAEVDLYFLADRIATEASEVSCSFSLAELPEGKYHCWVYAFSDPETNQMQISIAGQNIQITAGSNWEQPAWKHIGQFDLKSEDIIYLLSQNNTGKPGLISIFFDNQELPNPPSFLPDGKNSHNNLELLKNVVICLGAGAGRLLEEGAIKGRLDFGSWITLGSNPHNQSQRLTIPWLKKSAAVRLQLRLQASTGSYARGLYAIQLQILTERERLFL